MTRKSICSTCGDVGRIGASFCPRCGTAFRQVPPIKVKTADPAYESSVAEVRSELHKVELQRAVAERMESQFAHRRLQPKRVPSFWAETLGFAGMMAGGAFLATREDANYLLKVIGILTMGMGFIALIWSWSSRRNRLRLRSEWEARDAEISTPFHAAWNELNRIKEAELRVKPPYNDTSDNHNASA